MGADGRAAPTAPSVTPTELVLILSGVVALAGYVAFILVPAWTSYGRVWERIAASFLTLFILGSLLALGGVLGLTIVWFYDRFA